jgi:hypothetical protein
MAGRFSANRRKTLQVPNETQIVTLAFRAVSRRVFLVGMEKQVHVLSNVPDGAGTNGEDALVIGDGAPSTLVWVS